MTVRTENREDGVITAVCGASRSGKTASVKAETKDAPRLLAWDVRGEYSKDARDKIKRITSAQSLYDTLTQNPKAAGRYAYVANGDPVREFELFCQLAYWWLVEWPAAIVADELGFVTNAGKAPPGWFRVVSQGAYWGGYIYGICQRTTEADKTLWGNAHVKRCFTLDNEKDRYSSEARLGIPAHLIPLEKYKFVEKEIGEQPVTGMTTAEGGIQYD